MQVTEEESLDAFPAGGYDFFTSRKQGISVRTLISKRENANGSGYTLRRRTRRDFGVIEPLPLRLGSE